jgi:hypothetical protein
VGDAMIEDNVSRPVFWIVVTSSIVTVFYTIPFSVVREGIPMNGPWVMATLASIFVNWASVSCDREGGRFNQLASYACASVMLIANLTFFVMAVAMLLGPRSTLYRFIYISP